MGALLSLLLGLVSVPVHAVIYSSGIADAQWKVGTSVFECSLRHPIGAYGSAVFARRAGESETFRLHQQKLVLPPGNARLEALQPDWQGEGASRPLGWVTVSAGHDAVLLETARARELQGALEEGRRLMFTRNSGTADQSPVRVILEPLHFRAGIQEYRRCLTALLPVNFAQVERTAIYFQETAETLPNSELRKLDALIRYAKADPRVKSIFIDGHTDSVGVRPENLEISKARAELVATYLTDRQIPAELLTTRWHGERYPVASNATAAGRAQNRRVTLRLERD